MRILLCDRHLLLLEALAAALRRDGHDVVATTTRPDEAVAAAVEHDPDVCLLDVAFPGGPAVDTIARIREATRAKVLVLSARRDEGVVGAALAAGAAGFVGKDEGMADLLRSLEQVCAGEVVGSAGPAPARGRGVRAPCPAEPAGLRYLTTREREALRLIAEGQSTKEIAQSMDVAYSTARTHVQNVLTKLGVRSRLQAAALVARTGTLGVLDARRAVGVLMASGSANHRSTAPAKGGGAVARRRPQWPS